MGRSDSPSNTGFDRDNDRFLDKESSFFARGSPTSSPRLASSSATNSAKDFLDRGRQASPARTTTSASRATTSSPQQFLDRGRQKTQTRSSFGSSSNTRPDEPLIARKVGTTSGKHLQVASGIVL